MVRHTNARFNRKMPYPACISCHCHYHPYSFQFYSNILFLRTHREIIFEQWNYIDIQIYLISLWNMKCNYSFLFVMIIMSTTIDKCYWCGKIILPTTAFYFDCPIKIWHTRISAGSVIHSIRTFVITVSYDRESCRPHLQHLAAAVIFTRARCCLTAADHCNVMLGTIKFVDRSVNDNSERRLDNCDVIASCIEVRHAAQRSWTPNRD